jgi:hypothetical protein
LNAYQRWTETVPDEMTSSVALVPFPDISVLPGMGYTASDALLSLFGETTTRTVLDLVGPQAPVTDYQRLTELKAVYDPVNLFRLNHNIPPSDD